VNWITEFFRAIPEALRALYFHGDPAGAGQGWWGFVILAIWGIFFIAIPIALAKRFAGEREWLTATMGSIAGLAILWWIFGIIPSAWVYYADANQAILGDRIIPTEFTPFGIPVATNFYEVIRDTIVVVWHLVALAAVVWAALAVQKRFPRTLAPGEDKRDPGGYR
jgi:hypothetical protein